MEIIDRQVRRQIGLAFEIGLISLNEFPELCTDGPLIMIKDTPFNLYNAIGLQHQHEDLRTLLARVRSAELAALWCRFLSRESPARFRVSQVKGDEDALNHWGWHEEVMKHKLVSNAPLVDFKFV